MGKKLTVLGPGLWGFSRHVRAGARAFDQSMCGHAAQPVINAVHFLGVQLYTTAQKRLLQTLLVLSVPLLR